MFFLFVLDWFSIGCQIPKPQVPALSKLRALCFIEGHMPGSKRTHFDSPSPRRLSSGTLRSFEGGFSLNFIPKPDGGEACQKLPQGNGTWKSGKLYDTYPGNANPD